MTVFLYHICIPQMREIHSTIKIYQSTLNAWMRHDASVCALSWQLEMCNFI